MEEKKLTEQESLLIISQMINTAKQEQRDDGKGWIIWGWLLFCASLFTYINMQVEFVSAFFFWNAFGLVTLVWLAVTLVRHFFFPRPEKVKTYTSDLFAKLNVGYFVSLMFIIAAINIGGGGRGVNPVAGFSLLINLYGFWVLVYGAALSFKPSIVGAIMVWIVGFASLSATTFDVIMLYHAAAVLFGYIIPGHMANREFKKIKV